MNYINPTSVGAQDLHLNCNCAAGDAIDWTLTEEGDDDVAFSFASPSANFTLTSQGYFQTLSCDFATEGIDLLSERFYVLRGAVNGSDVFVGKVFVTEQDVESYSVNTGKYKQKDSTNNFIILD